MLSFLYLDDVLLHGGRTSHTINTRDRRHHDDIFPSGKQSRYSPQAQLVYLVVDGKIFLDISIRCRQVSLWLIVIVVRHIVLYSIFWKETFHFLVQLCCKSLVVAQHEGWLSYVGNDVCHCESLARACYSEQNLCRLTLLYAFGELSDGLWLVACRLVLGCQLKVHVLFLFFRYHAFFLLISCECTVF